MIPPRTDPTVVIKANFHAFFGFDKHMGNNITSGGIGKKDDSATLRKNK
jgi:hypothetical protein